MQVSLASHLLLTEDANFPFFYVKSTDFPLDQYTGEVEIEGMIANIYQSVPIILISHLSGQLL